MQPIKQKNLILVTSLVLSLFWASGAAASGPWQFVMSLPDSSAEIRLGETLALAVDETRQRYYVVDSSHGQLASFDHEGTFLAALNPDNQLLRPVSLALTQGAGLWVVERASNQLLHVNLKDQKLRAFDLADEKGAPIFPDKVVLGPNEELFVLDRGRGAVVQLDDNLKVVQTYVGGEGFQGFVDFRLVGDGLWALDSLNHSLTRFAHDGKPLGQVKLIGKLEFPVAFEVDDAGQFYLLDRHAGKVLVFSAQGELSYDLLLKGKRQGQLWYPSGLLFDWQGRLCVINEGNGRIDIYSR